MLSYLLDTSWTLENTTFLIEVHPWGDASLKKFPLQLATLMLQNGYKMQKSVPHYFFGSHYLFIRGNIWSRLSSFIYYLPVLFAEYVIYRYAPRSSVEIVDVLRKLFKHLRARARGVSRPWARCVQPSRFG